jgi:hypothetical protein
MIRVVSMYISVEDFHIYVAQWTLQVGGNHHSPLKL